MKSVVGHIRASGYLARSAFALCAAAAGAAALWPVETMSSLDGAAATPLDLSHLASADSDAVSRTPIFDPERRGWTAGGTLDDVLGRARQTAELRLQGVLLDDHQKRVFVGDGTPGAGWLKEGEGRNGWRVEKIEADKVILADARRHYTLEFIGPSVRLLPSLQLQKPLEPTRSMNLRPEIDFDQH